jgi:NAD(P)H-dependent FMN reductase
MVPISQRNRSAAPVSPVMSMPASDPVKMRAARDWVVAVIVTSAGADGGLAVTDHWTPLLSAR